VVADCAEDVRAILASLGISRVAVWGSSAGGPYALATAALLPEAVTAVCLFAPLGPYGAPGLDQEWADYLALSNRDGFAGGDEGWWEDWSASFHRWGFDLTTIQAPVILWHGLKDTTPPAAHSRWLARQIPHATAYFPSDQDHTNVEEDNRSTALAWLTQRASA
jgi:pimeloyl-ACP methyl ester carboxylesterase